MEKRRNKNSMWLHGKFARNVSLSLSLSPVVVEVKACSIWTHWLYTSITDILLAEGSKASAVCIWATLYFPQAGDLSREQHSLCWDMFAPLHARQQQAHDKWKPRKNYNNNEEPHWSTVLYGSEWLDDFILDWKENYDCVRTDNMCPRYYCGVRWCQTDINNDSFSVWRFC